jgi:hypothetical protein
MLRGAAVLRKPFTLRALNDALAGAMAAETKTADQAA